MSHADTRPLHIAERAGAVGFVAALTAAAAQVSVPLPFTPVPQTSARRSAQYPIGQTPPG